MQWDLVEKKQILHTVPFVVEELHLKDRTKAGPKHPYHRIACPDWVNILPITDDGYAILIRQSRAGNMRDVLEVPGGCIDKNEKDPTMAAVRELEEETGYSSQRILPLASINPNPAINTNKLHMFIALNCRLQSDRKHFPDEGEDIEVVKVPTKNLDELVRTGQIDSCLASLTIMLAERYIQIKP
jgi:ADP-ribose pyrophosphatase